jgi:signal transduction histidine kinase
VFSTLRARLIISHLLPYLIIIPLLGIALIYLVESQVILASVASELTGQGVLVAELAQNSPDIWDNPDAAASFFSYLSTKVDSRMMILATDGEILASNQTEKSERRGETIDLSKYDEITPGNISVNLDYSTHLHAEVIDVLLPVMGSEHTVVGFVRLSRRLEDIYHHFAKFRLITSGVLLMGLGLTLLIGVHLSKYIGRPLKRLAIAVQKLVDGQTTRRITEEGPEEIRILQRSFNLLVSRLRDLEQARRRLVSNLVHELGRSLGALRAAIQALMDGGNQDKELEYELVVAMDEETKRQRRLLDDLANLQDVISGGLELDPQPLSISEWLPDQLRVWESMARRKGLDWDVNIPRDLPLIVADPTRLDQALGNLLSNAIKFTPKGGAISVIADNSDDLLAIHVIDNGPGINLSEQERIFMPFYQGRHGDQTLPQGMGLGLNIARELIMRQDGFILLTSKQGEGSHFTVQMPLGEK